MRGGERRRLGVPERKLQHRRRLRALHVRLPQRIARLWHQHHHRLLLRVR